MVIGFGETPAQRVESLLRLREAQDRALAEHGNGFSAFISWTLQTKGVRIEGRAPGAGAFEYLQHVAAARLVLDNVVNHQASWPTMGYKVAQTALFAGATTSAAPCSRRTSCRKRGPAIGRRPSARWSARSSTPASSRVSATASTT
jgi:biotin synthase-like enzyme